MKLRYLVDENLSARVVATIQRHYPQLDVLRVGDPGGPPLARSTPTCWAGSKSTSAYW
jgi:hypothetical protein